MENIELVSRRFKDSIAVKKKIVSDHEMIRLIAEFANKIAYCVRNGGKLVLCGNGGSASDALHFAGEVIGRFQVERNPWPAIVLNADVATLTAVANDYGYNEVFSRQVKAYLTEKDLFMGISTSGNSENVLRASKIAKEKGALTAALLGKDGGEIGKIVDYPIIVRCNTTARVQETHITIIHIFCELVERVLTENE